MASGGEPRRQGSQHGDNELRKTNTDKTEDDFCRYCPEKPAKSYCTICSEYLCQECTSTHQKLSALKGHILRPIDNTVQGNVPLSGNQEYGDLTCKSHPSRLLDKVCETCSVPACETCVIEDHSDNDHVIVQPAEAIPLLKTLCLDASKFLVRPIHDLQEFKNKGKVLQNEYEKMCEELNQRKQLLVQCIEKRYREGLNELSAQKKSKTKTLKEMTDTAKISLKHIEELTIRLTGAFQGNDTDEMMATLQEFNFDKHILERAVNDLHSVPNTALNFVESRDVVDLQEQKIELCFQLKKDMEKSHQEGKRQSDNQETSSNNGHSLIKRNHTPSTRYTKTIYNTLRHETTYPIEFEILYPRATFNGIRFINVKSETIECMDHHGNVKSNIKLTNIRNLCTVKHIFVALKEDDIICRISNTYNSGLRSLKLGDEQNTKINTICSYGDNKFAVFFGNDLVPTVKIYEMGPDYPKLRTQFTIQEKVYANTKCFMEAYNSGGLVILLPDSKSITKYSSNGEFQSKQNLGYNIEAQITCLFIDATEYTLIGDDSGKVHLLNENLTYFGVVCDIKTSLCGIVGVGAVLYLFTPTTVEVHTLK